MNKQGTVVFAADYWPYGEKMAEYNAGGNTGQRYVFTEKERDVESGYDYFGARYYDSDIGRWLSVDPLMDKYPGWSPYNYVMGNTLNSFDPDGRDVIVLLAPKGAWPFGHAALLIRNEKKGWTYISKNGTQDNVPLRNVYGASKFTLLEQREGENLEEFLARAEYIDKQDYKFGYWMITDESQDKKMKATAQLNAEQLYKLFTNNCMDVVTAALESAGLNGGHVTAPVKSNGINTGVTYKKYHLVPIIRYKIIKATNVGFELILSNDTVYKRKLAEAGLE